MHNIIRESCYLPIIILCRKNPAHFKEYSHDFSSADADDGDSDYDDSDKPVCPFGADCYRYGVIV